VAAVRVLRHAREGDLTTADFAGADERWRVVVRTTQGPGVLLTCRAIRENPSPRHEVVEIARLP